MLSKHELSFLFRNSRSKLPLGATPIRAPTVREGLPHAWIPLPYGRGSDQSVFSRKSPPCASERSSDGVLLRILRSLRAPARTTRESRPFRPSGFSLRPPHNSLILRRSTVA